MTMRKCSTRKLKLAQSGKPIAKVQVGTIHLVNLQFPGGGVSDADLQTALQYLQLALPVISQYCAQYGVPAPTLDMTTTIQFTASADKYSDADLQNWVQLIVQEKGYGPNDTLVFINPPPGGPENTDAPVSQGVLGYHNSAPNPYCFINAIGTGFTIGDQADEYALALSHEIAEAMVDPAADGSKPEVCDPCAGNCNVDYRNYFDQNGNWLGGNASSWAFFVEGIATAAEANNCPADATACTYAPSSAPPPTPTPTPTPQPPGCIDLIKAGVASLESGEIAQGLEEIFAGIDCYLMQDFDKTTLKEKLEALRAKL